MDIDESDKPHIRIKADLVPISVYILDLGADLDTNPAVKYWNDWFPSPIPHKHELDSF